MTSKLKILLATGMVSAAMVGANPAFAAGTTAGTDIDNNVSVSFSVGGVSQTAKTASNSFKVDRKIIFSVAEKTPVGTTSVSPGQTGAITAFTVSNTSNDTLDFALSLAQLSGGTAKHGGTDAFNVTVTKICVDANKNGTCEVGEETAGTSATIDNLAADDSYTVWVYSDVPITATNGQVAGLTLTGTALYSNGSAITDAKTDSDANTAGVETIFADTGRDGVESDGDDYTVSAASLTVNKLSRVVSDGVSASNPKAIPGAVVEYCIAVTNGAGAATATGVTVSDNLTAMTNVTYDGGFGVLLNGTAVTGNTCTPGAGAGSFASNIVSGTLADIAAGETRTLVFRVTIN